MDWLGGRIIDTIFWSLKKKFMFLAKGGMILTSASAEMVQTQRTTLSALK